jgi:hypothetical protein
MRLWTTLLSLVVLAALAACNDSPTESSAAKALTLSPATAEIPADGVARVTLTAEIDPRAAADRRTVVFTTTAGTFVGATEEAGKKLSLAVDSAGRAQVELQSERTVRTAVVTASISVGNETLVVQRAEVRFVAADPSTLVRLSTSVSSAPADGATVVRVFADIAPGLPDGQRTVTFTTSLGSFADAAATTPKTTTATANAGNRATVDLRGPTDQIGQARVTATVAGTTQQTFVDFTRALPDTIVVDPSKSELKASASDSLTVTVTLLRDLGTVTKGTPVTLRVLNPQNHDDLHFLINGVEPSGDGGTTQATVSAGNTAYRGLATIEATVPNTLKKGEATILISNP